MTRIEEKKLRCAVCGKTFDGRILLSTNTMGPPDLDLRPAEMERSTLGTEINICPECHYVAYDITKEVSEKVRAFVYSDPEFQESYSSRSVQAYRNLMRIAVIEEDYHRAFCAYLKAAWVGESRYSSKPSSIRNEVLEFFQKYEDKLKFDDGTRFCIKADLLRRTGHFEEVIKFVQSTRSSDELIENILAFEKYLAENNDVGCYTVGSAVSWKKGK